MKLRHKIKGLKAVGIGNALRAFPYAWWKGHLDKSYARRQKPGIELPPGRLLRTVPEKWGVILSFDNATLEVRYLAPKVIRVTWTPGIAPVPYVTGDAVWPEMNIQAEGGRQGWNLDSGELKAKLGPDGGLELFNPYGGVVWKDLPPVNQ